MALEFPGANLIYFPEGWGLGRGFFGLVFEAASTPVYSDIPKSPSSFAIWRETSSTFIVFPSFFLVLGVSLTSYFYLPLSGSNLDPPGLESTLLSMESFDISS